MDSSAARDENSSQQATALPEEGLNTAILCMAFVYKAMNGLGTLATIWATVVLLGGFATLVKEKDFWYVTVIAFIQSIGILGGYEDPAHQIFLRAPRTLIKNTGAAEWEQRISWWRRRRNQLQQHQPRDTRRAHRQLKKHEEDIWGMKEWRTLLGVAIHVALWLAQVAAVATCVVLSWKRLSEHDYVDQGQEAQANHRNINRSLNIFYGLVLAQGIIFICLLADVLVFCSMIKAGREYKLGLNSGRQILFCYKNDNYLEYITGNVHATLNMDLVTFAKKLAVSDSGNADDRLVGVRAMDRIFRSVEYSSLALMRLRASLDADALGKLVNMLGIICTPLEQDVIRGHAARVVLKLAPDLLVESFPQILYLISSSLLNTANKKMGNMDVDLIWFGLRILDKLTDNPDNCIQAKNTAGDLLSKIIDLTNLCGRSSMSNTISDSWIEEEIIPLLQKEDDIPPPSILKIDQEIIVGMSLNILSKLVAAITADNYKDRLKFTSKILKSANFLRNSGMILEHVEATRVIACLAVDEKARKDIGKLPGIIKKLKDCLLSKAPHVNITKVAAKLLLLEYTSSEQLSQIQSSIEENHILEGDQSLLLPVSAFIEELDLDQLVPKRMQSVVQSLDLEDLISAPRVNLSETAAEALVLLTTGCKDNVAAFLQEITKQELQTIVKMLAPEDEEKRRMMLSRLQGRNVHPETSRIVKKIICVEDGEHRRSMNAKLLQNLRGCGTENFNEFMQVIDQALPKVLKTIIGEVVKLEDPASTSENLADVKDDLRIKEGKVLESFIGLAVQICRTSLNANDDFDKTLKGANLPVNMFVQKLKKILDVYKSPTIDFPSIRRSTLELMTWMAENCIYREILLQCGVYEQVEEVAKTARELESFELFHCGVGVANHTTTSLSISCIVINLQAQLALSPNFEERSHCHREHAGNITVLIA